MKRKRRVLLAAALLLLVGVAVIVYVRQRPANPHQLITLTAESKTTDSVLDQTTSILRTRMRALDPKATVARHADRFTVRLSRPTSIGQAGVVEGALQQIGSLELRQVLDSGSLQTSGPQPDSHQQPDREGIFTDTSARTWYRLGPTELTAPAVQNASAELTQPNGTHPATWVVNLQLAAKPSSTLTTITARLKPAVGQPPHRLAIIVDGII